MYNIYKRFWNIYNKITKTTIINTIIIIDITRFF